MTNEVTFDADEYLHLALHASSIGDHHACMTYLKELLRQQPAHAAALYLLAAQYAELGLGERAISTMKAALTIAPELDIARFQLAVLLLDRGYTFEAKDHLLTIKRHGTLSTCAQALIAAADGDRRKAREKLEFCVVTTPADRRLVTLAQRLVERLARPNAVAEHGPGPFATGADSGTNS